jgi:hypothetical protein
MSPYASPDNSNFAPDRLHSVQIVFLPRSGYFYFRDLLSP